ncbi:MAG: hypothetical protein JWM98_2802 [Thermoleophilia bacterium]|nr:hypothetical protein [Thermoleophilia bacterium]
MQTSALAAPVVVPPRNAAATVDVRPLDPVSHGTLHLDQPDSTGRSFVSAASGLVASGSGSAWAVSDEYGELARFGSVEAPGHLHAGLEHHKNKPDLEAVLVAPASLVGGRHAALVGFGSGSSATRERGVVTPIGAMGKPVGPARPFDLHELYAALDAKLPLQPNIEGATLRDSKDGAELLLFHRGKEQGDLNTVFVLDAAAALGAAAAGTPIPASALRAQHDVDLGSLGGERLGFADARTLPDGRIAFLASSEGEDATGDGAIHGSVVGMLDANFAVTALRPLTGPARKAEGIERTRALDGTSPNSNFTLVTDPDDPDKPTELLTVDLG